MSTPLKFTQKQRLFVEAYAGNAKEAALAAGYSEKTAAFIGSENLKKPKLVQAIKEREQSVLASLVADREERQRFLTGIMRNPGEGTRDRLKACDQLSRMDGDYIDRHIYEIPGSLGVAACEQRSLSARERLLVLRSEREGQPCET